MWSGLLSNFHVFASRYILLYVSRIPSQVVGRFKASSCSFLTLSLWTVDEALMMGRKALYKLAASWF
jgi:hypothetical protein